MHVVHVINQLSGGGAETSLRDILVGTTTPELRHTVVVLGGADRFDDLAGAGIDVLAPVRPLAGWAARIGHVQHALRRTQPDLVHTTLFDADVAGRVAARTVGVPCITSLVNTPYSRDAMGASGTPRWRSYAVRTVDRALSRHATSAFHAITQVTAEAAVRDLHIEPDRIHVVPRGRDPDRLGLRTPARSRAVRQRLGIGADRPVVVNLARQEPQKGLGHLIDAIAQARVGLPGILLLQAGRQGNSTSALERRIRGLAVAGQVRFLGPRSDIGDLLAAADVFAFPSLYEGLGGAVLEAMAIGTPIVASDIPALREVLDHGRCGRLVPPADPAALCDALVDVLSHPDAAARTAAAARGHFDRTYGLAACLAGMRQLYADLAADAPPAPREDSAC